MQSCRLIKFVTFFLRRSLFGVHRFIDGSSIKHYQINTCFNRSDRISISDGCSNKELEMTHTFVNSIMKEIC